MGLGYPNRQLVSLVQYSNWSMLAYTDEVQSSFISFYNREEWYMMHFRRYICLISYICEAMISMVKIVIFTCGILIELFHSFRWGALKLKHFLWMPWNKEKMQLFGRVLLMNLHNHFHLFFWVMSPISYDEMLQINILYHSPRK